MAADYNKPVTTDNYADLLTQLRDNIAAAQSLLKDLTGVTNIPTGAVRYDQTAKKFQTYNGTSFVDSVLSPAGGGTGITNWAKASAAEAEAGTPDKYPDSAGVLASINANGYFADSAVLIWSGSASSYDLDSAPGGYPGDGFYVVKEADSGAYLSVYAYSGGSGACRGAVDIRHSSNVLTLRSVYFGSINNVIYASEIIVNAAAGTVSSGTLNITEIYKIC